MPAPVIDLSERERELGAIIRAYSDVTERLKDAHEQLNGEVQRLRDELKRKNKALRRSERLAALGEMAAGLAHEVRNPLGGIALYSSMLESRLEGQDEAQSAARKISCGVRTLDRLVSEILDFAQEDRLERQSCSLGRVLTEVAEDLRPWVRDTGAEATLEPSAYAVDLDCDPLRLRQALSNLLLNGLQAAGSGGSVRLSAEAYANGSGVEISIEDDGPGISEEALERIFNPFFTTKAEGTGLGLAIVHRIVEAHGGSVRAVNRAGGGACFSVCLPTVVTETKRMQDRLPSEAGSGSDQDDRDRLGCGI